HSSALSSMAGLVMAAPALQMAISMTPSAPWAASSATLTDAGSETSMETANALAPSPCNSSCNCFSGSRRRPASTTSAPAFASVRAKCAPRPPAAPVTSALRPARLNMVLSIPSSFWNNNKTNVRYSQWRENPQAWIFQASINELVGISAGCCKASLTSLKLGGPPGENTAGHRGSQVTSLYNPERKGLLELRWQHRTALSSAKQRRKTFLPLQRFYTTTSWVPAAMAPSTCMLIRLHSKI